MNSNESAPEPSWRPDELASLTPSLSKAMSYIDPLPSREHKTVLRLAARVMAASKEGEEFYAVCQLFYPPKDNLGLLAVSDSRVIAVGEKLNGDVTSTIIQRADVRAFEFS